MFWKVLISSIVLLNISTRPINEKSLLERHNFYRQNVGVPPLVLNKECQVSAQKWAEHLAKTNNGLSHSNNKYGQNCFYSTTKVSEKYVVDYWASEIKYFNQRTKKYSHKSGHYSQIVWKKTKYVGVGMAIAKDGTEYWVCNYYPAGNYTNEKAY